MKTPYTIHGSNPDVLAYYNMQDGFGVSVFPGKTQMGYGIGDAALSFFKSATPLLKMGARALTPALKTGAKGLAVYGCRSG